MLHLAWYGYCHCTEHYCTVVATLLAGTCPASHKSQVSNCSNILQTPSLAQTHKTHPKTVLRFVLFSSVHFTSSSLLIFCFTMELTEGEEVVQAGCSLYRPCPDYTRGLYQAWSRLHSWFIPGLVQTTLVVYTGPGPDYTHGQSRGQGVVCCMRLVALVGPGESEDMLYWRPRYHD